VADTRRTLAERDHEDQNDESNSKSFKRAHFLEQRDLVFLTLGVSLGALVCCCAILGSSNALPVSRTEANLKAAQSSNKMITELEKGSSNTSMKNSSRQSNTSNLEELGGWRYSQQRCSSKKGIVFRVSKKEREKGRLSRRRLQKAVEIFQKCGVVALEGAISAAKTKKFRDDLNTEMEPILQSRSRVRGILERSMISHGSPINLWEENVSGIQEELFFTQGHVFRERNDGRIDMRVTNSIMMLSRKISTDEPIA